MSDFLLDLRPRRSRALDSAAEQLRFADDARSIPFNHAMFGLVIVQTGDPTVWGPHVAADGSLVAIAGRPVFDAADWEAARRADGNGGLAARLVHTRYAAEGIAALERLNGTFVVIVYDQSRQVLHLVTDYCGAFPAFEFESSEGNVYCSHPDVLADAAGETHRLDEAAIAEFVLTGTVTPPFTYYRRVRACDFASVYTHRIGRNPVPQVTRRRYFEFTYRGQFDAGEMELANMLADAVRRSVHRRTLPELGPCATALSGGLDSRVVLASSRDTRNMLAFCCYDEPNRELRTAEEIARTLSVRFLPIRRTAEYYAEHAEAGVRISGGMGSLANNHFLGVIPSLKTEGIRTLLTGCYCDYLFKALPLNRRVHWLTRREELGRFQHQFYFDHYAGSTTLGARAQERWESRIPRELQTQDSDGRVFQIEARRTFPLCYEGDNQQRVVPQRIMGWCPPFVDRDVIDVYCRIPYRFKLNRSVFRRVTVALAPTLTTIPDANTGAGPDASPLSEWVSTNSLRLHRTWRRFQRSAITDESWPDWAYQVAHGRALDALWQRPNPNAMDFFRRVLGGPFDRDQVSAIKQQQPFLFLGLLTVKLWLDRRA